jgi:hypothetical protein
VLEILPICVKLVAAGYLSEARERSSAMFHKDVVVGPHFICELPTSENVVCRFDINPDSLLQILFAAVCLQILRSGIVNRNDSFVLEVVPLASVYTCSDDPNATALLFGTNWCARLGF